MEVGMGQGDTRHNLVIVTATQLHSYMPSRQKRDNVSQKEEAIIAIYFSLHVDRSILKSINKKTKKEFLKSCFQIKISFKADV